MPWPSITDFTGAIQNPSECFHDPELAQGMPTWHPLRGTPLVYSGNFASVYPLSCASRKFAVRCFTREVKDQKERYDHLSNYLRHTLPPTLVEFEFHEQGIRVRGEWYPIVKMEWVNGDPLNRYVSAHLDTPSGLSRIARRWRGAVGDLLSREIAHNDLQHGNVMVQEDGDIKLVDYDGIFLPQYRGQPSPEIGHQNFQHPLRTSQDYAGYVDNFPALVIYLSLLALDAEPRLWERFNNDDNLIFKKSDYADPSGSECFRALMSSPSDTVRELAGYLQECCTLPPNRIADLDSILESGSPAAPAPPPPFAPPADVVSEYRRMIQAGRAPSPLRPSVQPGAAPSAPVAPPPVPGRVVRCPQCGQLNMAAHIYCEAELCAATLHPGNRYCAYCGESNPINVKYCPECGRLAS